MSKDGRSATRVCTDMTKNADVDESPVYNCARNNGPLRVGQHSPGVIVQEVFMLRPYGCLLKSSQPFLLNENR
jgi:hypothetical protein